jgi:hypothetical protein
MKANLALANLTVKTGRFHPGHDEPIRRYIMRQNYKCFRSNGLVGLSLMYQRVDFSRVS